MQYLAKKPYLVIFILTLFFIFIFVFFLSVDHILFRTSISSFFAVILSPRKKKLITETGEKTQITWLFLKKPIILD
jgi:predicted PurR-regulated permease PerM